MKVEITIRVEPFEGVSALPNDVERVVRDHLDALQPSWWDSSLRRYITAAIYVDAVVAKE